MTHNWARQCSSACKQKPAGFHITLVKSGNSTSCYLQADLRSGGGLVRLIRLRGSRSCACSSWPVHSVDLLPETALALLSHGRLPGGDGAWGEERPRRSHLRRRSGAVMRQSNTCRLHQRRQWDVCSPAAWQTATACEPPAGRGARLGELGAGPVWSCPSPLAV